MPVKYGLTTAKALAALDLDRRGLPWCTVNRRFAQAGLVREALNGMGPLLHGLIWNGVLLPWRAGISESLQAGLSLAERQLADGALALTAGDTPSAGHRPDPAGC